MVKKQKELPGMERPTIKELDDAMERVFAAAEAQKKAKKELDDAKLHLVEVAKKHRQTVYRDETASLVLVLEDGPTKVKVTKVGDASGSEDEESEEEGDDADLN
ncbi:MAG: hypothetical protein ACOZQL_10520 [Myxococcota bacterium]